MRRAHTLRCQARAAFALAAWAVLGCGPVASFRPASGLMPDRRIETGLGVSEISARPYVNESGASAGQAWLTGDVARRLSLTGIAAFDDDAAALGGAARFTPVRVDRFVAGFEQELGYAWYGVSTPMAVRVVGAASSR